MLKAVLFDMDGVLLDSEEYITRAGILMFKEKGFKVEPENFKEFTGMGEDRFLGGVAEKNNIPFNIEIDKARTYQIYEELVAGKLTPLNGVKEFIAKCRKKGLKLAVATSADEVKMKINLRETGLGEKLFDTLVNGLDVEYKKPAPDIYLEAARRINVNPADCLVVEDAISGMQSAKAAGCKCLAITTSFHAEKFYEAEWNAPDLTQAPEECLLW
jgi:HAD superfamily hydrolase (TIGR01509 family)